MQDRRVIRQFDDWAAMRARFRWHVPGRFNIAERCCDSWAAREPDRLAIRHLGRGGGEDWSYGRLKAASDGLAASLKARGIGRGDRVAVLLPQCPEVMVTHFAAQKLGAVVVPVFTLFGAEALEYRLRDSGARAIVTDADNLDKLMALDLPEMSLIYCTGASRAPVLSLQAEITAAHRAPAVAASRADDPAVLIYTSGTTGPPKGVLHAHRFLLGHLPNIEVSHEGFPQPGDCGWTPADWAWIGGLMDMAIPCLYYGVPLLSHRMRKFDPDAAFRLIAEQRARNLFLPPTALKLMRQAVVPDDVDIRTISSGGESLGAELLDWGRQRLGAPINEIYGQTECNLVVAGCQTVMTPRPGAMGQAVPGADVAILSEDGQVLDPGETGQIAVRRGHPGMFLEYWQKPEQTAAKFRGDWMLTGDLGVADADGFLTFVARDDDIISSAGYRIGPSEIENCLLGHPDVVMAAVIGLPDPLRGEMVCAVVVPRDGEGGEALAQALTARVAERVSPHVAPRRVVFRNALPVTATGKIMRRTLRDELGGGAPA